ncbi:MAG: HPF/RaiA family ribosome-associated protein, partial [Candidatus Omnitrophica bacterium]|nr:HPF/RaiA family ribosome-associated protein [Candidatus Omnitrophota bacterium]
MQNPLEITFHNTKQNSEIETVIQEKFEKLKQISPDLTKCHIVLEKLSKHHQTANTACARLDLKVPHISDIVISEKCNEDEESLKSAVIKVFKRSQAILREEKKHRRDRNRTPRP